MVKDLSSEVKTGRVSWFCCLPRAGSLPSLSLIFSLVKRETYNTHLRVIRKMQLTLWPCGLQHTRLPCPSLSPGVWSDSCPLTSVMPSNHFILCHPLLLLPSSFSASGFFPVSQFFSSGGQSIGVSASASVLPKNTRDWFPLGWTGWISL